MKLTQFVISNCWKHTGILRASVSYCSRNVEDAETFVYSGLKTLIAQVVVPRALRISTETLLNPANVDIRIENQWRNARFKYFKSRKWRCCQRYVPKCWWQHPFPTALQIAAFCFGKCASTFPKGKTRRTRSAGSLQCCIGTFATREEKALSRPLVILLFKNIFTRVAVWN